MGTQSFWSGKCVKQFAYITEQLASITLILFTVNTIWVFKGTMCDNWIHKLSQDRYTLSWIASYCHLHNFVYSLMLTLNNSRLLKGTSEAAKIWTMWCKHSINSHYASCKLVCPFYCSYIYLYANPFKPTHICYHQMKKIVCNTKRVLICYSHCFLQPLT